MSFRLRFFWAAGFTSVLFAAGPAFSKDICTREAAANMNTAAAFCSCESFSREAILLLESKQEQPWFANGVSRQCPLRAGFVLKGLRWVASSETQPKLFHRTQSSGGSDIVIASGDETSTSTLAGSETPDTTPSDPPPTDPVPPAPPSIEPGFDDSGSKERDDNGHGNDADGVDESNPGLKL